MPLIGLALALAILMALGTSLMGPVQRAYADAKVSTAVGEILTARNRIHDGFSGRASYSGLSATKARDLGLLPSSMAGGKGPMHTTLRLTSNGDQFTITLGGNRAAENHALCVALVTQHNQAWSSVTVDGKNMTGARLASANDTCDRADTIALRSY